ncbi:hypothetical protein BJ912DRAFT_1063873 [Pholiota molesta]|nr:hypothetical protein BJ912DRAFT_1063873 [Pholiota molesta]
MAGNSTNMPALIGRSHTVATVKPTFEDLDKLDLAQLREYAKHNAGLDCPKLTREALLRFVCVLEKIRHPDDGNSSPVHKPSLSPTLLSVSRRAAAQRPPVGEASSPTSSVLLKYSVDRAKRLDTRRFSSPLENEEDNAKFKDDLDPEGFNRLASNSTPEPDEHPVQAPPAGTISLAQTAKMLQAFGKRYEDLAKHIKEIPNTAQALKRTAANLMQPMERYLNYYMQEQPLFAHEVVFPPNEPVFVISRGVASVTSSVYSIPAQEGRRGSS